MSLLRAVWRHCWGWPARFPLWQQRAIARLLVLAVLIGLPLVLLLDRPLLVISAVAIFAFTSVLISRAGDRALIALAVAVVVALVVSLVVGIATRGSLADLGPIIGLVAATADHRKDLKSKRREAAQ